MRLVTVLLVVSIAIIAIGILFAYAFRTEEITGVADGAIILKHRWGRPAELISDFNRDGTADSRRILDPNSGDFTLGTFVESYESSHCNGIFDVHIVFTNGNVQMIEYDSDSDGNYDLFFQGSEAQALQERRPDSCQGLLPAPEDAGKATRAR